MPIPSPQSEPARFCGQALTTEQTERICEVVETCSGLSRTELAATVCDLLEWRRPNGRLKTHECRRFLEDLEALGRLELPARQPTRPRGRRTTVRVTARGEAQPELTGTVGDVASVTVELVAGEAERLLWRELVGRHHYLGHTMPFWGEPSLPGAGGASGAGGGGLPAASTARG